MDKYRLGCLMKRIDFHIHTLPSPLDTDFSFSERVLSEHIKANQLDGIAITNHDFFDLENYKAISDKFSESVTIFPGIEVSVESFHVLVIGNRDSVDTFKEKCDCIPERNQDEDGIPLKIFIDLFCNGSYLIIPHYGKKPAITKNALVAMREHITALEASNDKKRISVLQEYPDIPVVLFSDFRTCANNRSSGRYTYLDVASLQFHEIQLAFQDPDKVHRNARKGQIEIAPNLYASEGLNVVIGGRSSGKTYLLETLYKTYGSENAKYVKQFQIVQDASDGRFKTYLTEEEDALRNAYYKEMRSIFDYMKQLESREKAHEEIAAYVKQLKNYAELKNKDDIYSKSPLFSSGHLPKLSSSSNRKVVEAIITLLADTTMKSEIDQVIGKDRLRELLGISIELFKKQDRKAQIRLKANNIIDSVKKVLVKKSSVPECPTSPLVNCFARAGYVKRLSSLRDEVLDTKEIQNTRIGDYSRVVTRVPYRTLTDQKRAIGTSEALKTLSSASGEEYIEILLSLKDARHIERALFDLEVSLSNKNGDEVSGGQRAEYLFYQAVENTAGYDIILIDEPESSFDNPFLHKEIIDRIKRMSRVSTVFITTHNNVLGASSRADGIILTTVDDSGTHDIYSGLATSDRLTNSAGETIDRAGELITLMEAGLSAYNERKGFYGLTNQ